VWAGGTDTSDVVPGGTGGGGGAGEQGFKVEAAVSGGDLPLERLAVLGPSGVEEVEEGSTAAEGALQEGARAWVESSDDHAVAGVADEEDAIGSEEAAACLGEVAERGVQILGRKDSSSGEIASRPLGQATDGGATLVADKGGDESQD
jgi:hypothetical protein